MSNLTSFDWWLATYLVAAGFGYAFYIGQLIVKLLLIRFASDKRIDDGLWRLGSLLETHYGELKENETITIQGKRAARTVLTGMCYSVGSATRQGSSSLTRFIGQSAMTSRT